MHGHMNIKFYVFVLVFLTSPAHSNCIFFKCTYVLMWDIIWSFTIVHLQLPLASKVHIIQRYVRKNETIPILNSLQDKVRTSEMKGPIKANPIPIYVTPILDTEETDKAVI
jgi:hypothetical protein